MAKYDFTNVRQNLAESQIGEKFNIGKSINYLTINFYHSKLKTNFRAKK